ncbi:MAG: C2H2-type zinc finger protein [Promethearchaeota archaeon]
MNREKERERERKREREIERERELKRREWEREQQKEKRKEQKIKNLENQHAEVLGKVNQDFLKKFDSSSKKKIKVELPNVELVFEDENLRSPAILTKIFQNGFSKEHFADILGESFAAFEIEFKGPKVVGNRGSATLKSRWFNLKWEAEIATRDEGKVVIDNTFSGKAVDGSVAALVEVIQQIFIEEMRRLDDYFKLGSMCKSYNRLLQASEYWEKYLEIDPSREDLWMEVAYINFSQPFPVDSDEKKRCLQLLSKMELHLPEQYSTGLQTLRKDLKKYFRTRHYLQDTKLSIAGKKRDRFLERYFRPIWEKIVEGRKTKCPFCKKKFKTVEELERHKEENHSFRCSFCGAEFSSESNLNLHVEAKHHGGGTGTRTKNKDFKCKYCSRKFSTEQGLRSHHKAKHPNEPLQ